jgi:hypothetical protein
VKKGPDEDKRRITVTAYVTRTEPRQVSDIEYKLRDEESGKKLTEVRSGGSDDEDLFLNERSEVVTILKDGPNTGDEPEDHCERFLLAGRMCSDPKGGAGLIMN